MKIEIQGHTDNTGRQDYNYNLSNKRARVLKDYLIAHGVENEIKTFGLGDSEPLFPNNSREGRQGNRRVEIFLLTNDKIQ